jgi:lysozyme
MPNNLNIADILTIVIPFLKKWEGLHLTAYMDQGGRYTIGYGSTGPGIEAGTQWSTIEAEQRLQEDVESLLPRIQAIVHVPLTNNQMAALTSFSYNLGVFNLQRSGLLKKLNVNDYVGAADQLLLWNKVGLYVSAGLSSRRQSERALFLTTASPKVPSDIPQPVSPLPQD